MTTKTILIFDPAECAGGAFSRAVNLAAELDDFHFVFLTYIPFKKLYNGKLPKNWTAIRLYSPFNPHHAHDIKNKLGEDSRLKKIMHAFIDAMLQVNKASVFLQAILRLRRLNITIIQSNNGIHYLPYRLAKQKKIPLLYYFRDLQYFKNYPAAMIQAAYANIFVGKNLQECYQQQLSIAPEKCQVIHSPFDVYQRINYEPSGDLEDLKRIKAQNKKILLCASRICPEKGQDVILDAFIEIHAQQHNTVLIFAGEAADNYRDRQYLARLVDTVATLQLEHRVLFLGHRNDPLHLLSLSDIAIQAPTYFEALAGSLVEALQLGIPTISSNVGGANEVLIEGKTGFLFPNRDYKALATILSNILNNRIDTNPIIEQGKTYSQEKWSAKLICEKMKEVYDGATN